VNSSVAFQSFFPKRVPSLILHYANSFSSSFNFAVSYDCIQWLFIKFISSLTYLLVASEENQFGGALCQFCGHLLKPFKAILWVLFIVLLWLAYKNEKVAKFLFKLQNYIRNTFANFTLILFLNLVFVNYLSRSVEHLSLMFISSTRHIIYKHH
jgi:hypothetical protein